VGVIYLSLHCFDLFTVGRVGKLLADWWDKFVVKVGRAGCQCHNSPHIGKIDIGVK